MKKDVDNTKMKGGEEQMENLTVQRKIQVWREKCPYCEKIVEGTSESQVKFNLNVHISAKHPSKQKNGKQ